MVHYMRTLAAGKRTLMITRLCVLVLGHAVVSAAQEVETLHLAQTVPVPGVSAKVGSFWRGPAG
jgi:uncharacterized membrane protein